MTVSILSVAECRTAIGEIKGSARSLQDRIHTVAVSCLAHVRDHGDWTLATGLLDVLPNGQRVKALAHWFGHFSNGKAKFSLDKATGAWTCDLAKDRTDGDFDVDGANEVTFADLTTEAEARTMDTKVFEKTMARYANNDKLNKDGSPKVTPEARALAARVVSLIREGKLAA